MNERLFTIAVIVFCFMLIVGDVLMVFSFLAKGQNGMAIFYSLLTILWGFIAFFLMRKVGAL